MKIRLNKLFLLVSAALLSSNFAFGSFRLITDENDLKPVKVIEQETFENLNLQQVSVVNRHTGIYSRLDFKNRVNAKPPTIRFSEVTKNLWRELGFSQTPFLVSGTNILNALNIPQKCRYSADLVHYFTRQYAYNSQRGQNRQAEDTYTQKIVKQLEASKQNECGYWIRGAYLLGSLSALDVSQSFWTVLAMHTPDGFRLTPNGPLLLLTAYLINQGRLHLFSSAEVLTQSKVGKWVSSPAAGSKVMGAYNCESPGIFINGEQRPYDLAGVYYHELSHMFRDLFAEPVPGLSEKEMILLEESIGILTGAVWQLQTRDWQETAKEQYSTEFAKSPSLKPTSDFSLFSPQGKLEELYYSIYLKPHQRSTIPGILPIQVYPQTMALSLDFLEYLFSKSLLAGKSARSSADETLQELNQRTNKLNAVLGLIARSYFPQEKSSFRPYNEMLSTLKSNFDPFSEWMSRADRQFVLEGTLQQILRKLPENDTSGAGEFAVETKNGKYLAYYETVFIQKNPSDLEKFKLKVGNSSETLDVRYDLTTLLKWLKTNEGRFQRTSKSCEHFVDDHTDLGSYVGRKLKLKLNNAQFIKPGEKGVKPGEKGVKPGEKGVKPALSTSDEGFFVRPMIRIPEL